jgi:hypothetical protein
MRLVFQNRPHPFPSVSSAVENDLDELRRENESLRHYLRLRTARDELTRTLISENARSPNCFSRLPRRGSSSMATEI